MSEAIEATAPAYVLALDTSLSAVSACVLEVGSGDLAAIETMPMMRGHAEALMPLLDRVVSALDGGFSRLSRIAVTVGPGSFTGIRVGVAAARAIALACKVPAVGVSTLSALAAPAIAAGLRSTVAAAIDAHHGNVYLQSFAPDGATEVAPALLSVRDAVRLLGRGPIRLVGSGAALLAAESWALGLNIEVDEKTVTPDVAYVARLGLLADPARALPRPFYLKAPDAKPQTHGVIARAD